MKLDTDLDNPWFLSWKIFRNSVCIFTATRWVTLGIKFELLLQLFERASIGVSIFLRSILYNWNAHLTFCKMDIWPWTYRTNWIFGPRANITTCHDQQVFIWYWQLINFYLLSRLQEIFSCTRSRLETLWICFSKGLLMFLYTISYEYIHQYPDDYEYMCFYSHFPFFCLLCDPLVDRVTFATV